MTSLEYEVPNMVGRDEELDQLKELLHSTIDGKGNTVLVSGEAGIGKTRLVRELEAYAESLGVKTLEGCCLYESPTPFLPFRDALRTLFQISKSDVPQLRQRKIKKTIKESAPEFVQAIPIVGNLVAGLAVAYRTYRDEMSREEQMKLGGLFERDEGLESISSVLVAVSAKQPLLLFIDDLHLADTPSLSLLYYLAKNAGGSKILVVGAYRPEEIERAYEGTVHPLSEILRRMSRDDLFQKIEIRRLNRPDCSHLVLSMLDAELGDLAELIHEETEGNPFFAIEALKLLIQQGMLTKKAGCWKLSGSIDDIEIPPRVYDVVVRRINALESKERNLLDCASVAGETFSSAEVGAASGLDRIELLQTLGSIERKHRLIHSFGDGYRFDHSKIKEVLYNEIPPELRKEYHSIIADYIEKANEDHLEEVVNELAHHYFQSGNAQKGIPYLLDAGEDATEKWAVFEAVKLYSNALEMMGNDERWNVEKTRTLEALGDVYALTAQHDKANECYEKGIASATEKGRQSRMQRKIREKRSIDRDGVKLAYYVYGKGTTTLVFVIAWIWTAEHWLPQVNYFSRDFKMVTIDMRGAGESDKPPDNYMLDLYVDDLNAIIEELQDTNIVLVGECIGASIAMKYVAKYPEKISKLVLVSASPKFMAADDYPQGFPQDGVKAFINLFQESYFQGLKIFMKWMFPEAGTEYLKEWGFKLSQKTTKEIALNSFGNLVTEDLRPLLKNIKIPVLILHGENDQVVRPANAEYLHENIPRSEMHIFMNKGHFPSITAAERFNEILKEFIMADVRTR